MTCIFERMDISVWKSFFPFFQISKGENKIMLTPAYELRNMGKSMQSVIRSIDILTPDMDKAWLGHELVVEQIKRSILKNRRIQVSCEPRH